jgi:hypothetical protein
VVAAVFSGPLPAGTQQIGWDGSGVPDGSYVVAVIANGPFGQTRHQAALTITH